MPGFGPLPAFGILSLANMKCDFFVIELVLG